jgi:hypothetical protein
MKFEPGSFVEVPGPKIPFGWSNNPARLSLGYHFSGNGSDTKADLKDDCDIPNARPIITNADGVYLLDGGDGNYYFWADISGFVTRIEEPDLEKILIEIGRGNLSRIPQTPINFEFEEADTAWQTAPKKKKGLSHYLSKFHLKAQKA